MHTVVIAGATGVVGSRTLALLLDRPDVGQVIAVGRRAPAVEHPKLTASIVDMHDPAPLSAALPNPLSAAFCCLGSTMKQAGSKEAFFALDHDAVVAFAKAAREAGASAFGLVSSLGASARSGNFYLQTKGLTEEDVAALGFATAVILRPSMIDDQGRRDDFRLVERVGLPLARAAFGLLGKASRYAPVTADAIARALVHEVLDGQAGADARILESDAIQRFAHTR